MSCENPESGDKPISNLNFLLTPQSDSHFASQQKVYKEVGNEMLEHALEG